MEPFTKSEQVQNLRRAIAYGVEKGKRNLIVDLALLKEILDGKVPVGNNEFPPEEVTAILYDVKAQRDKAIDMLQTICRRQDSCAFTLQLIEEFLKTVGCCSRHG